MVWKLRVLGAVTVLCLAVVNAQEPLTNDSVVKMVKAGLSADVIVSMVKTQPAKYDLTPDQIISLKSAGVPDRVVGAMVEKGSGGGVMAYADPRASGATPAAGTVAGGDPNDPMSPHDSGIYLYAKNKNGEYKLTELEQASYQGAKTGGFLASSLTYGIKKVKTKAEIPGQHASVKTPDTQPAFYFYFEDKAAGLGKGGFGSVSNPNQFALVKLDVTKTARETIVGQYGVTGASSGTDEKSMVTFKSEKLRSGMYKVAPNVAMEPGEYCFLASLGAAAGAAAAAQIFDFGVTPDQ